MRELHATIKGRVQGVMYRDFVRRHARTYGVLGTVRNCDDGSVEIVAQGSEESLKALITDMRRGPFFSRVESIAETWHEPDKQFDSFEIVY